MPGSHQEMEHAEHVAHAASEHEAKNKRIGVTMACIGALIAFCAALVGSERNELTRTMMEQTQAHSDYSGASVKYRAIMMELEKQRGRLAVLVESNAKSSGSMDLAVAKRFLRLSVDYSQERDLSKVRADSYKPLVDAHFEAAESYEKAQLFAELGIVLASLAVLLGNRPVWLGSIVLSVICLGQVALTALRTNRTVQAGLSIVRHSEEEYQDLRARHVGADEDAKTLEAIDPGGKIRRGEPLAEKAAAPPKPAGEEALSGK